MEGENGNRKTGRVFNARLRKRTVYFKLASLLTASSFLSILCSVVTPFWLVNEQLAVNIGVYYHCVDGDCTPDSDSKRKLNVYFSSTVYFRFSMFCFSEA